MGKRGPAKTPTNILEAKGSWLAKTRKNEPKGERDVPPAPEWVTLRGCAIWDKVTKQLAAMNVLCTIDAVALGRYCENLAKWIAAHEFVEKHGTVYPVKDKDGNLVEMKPMPQFTAMLRLDERLSRSEAAFGMTPSARASLAMDTTKLKKPEGIGELMKVQ